MTALENVVDPLKITRQNLKASRPRSPLPTEPGYELVGYRGQNPIVRAPGGQPFATGAVETNGSVPQGPVLTNQVGDRLKVLGMPKPRDEEAPVTPVDDTRKLKILFKHDGALWIGGDRKNPLKLEAYNPDQVFAFNNLGDGDKFVLTAQEAGSTDVSTLRNGKTVPLAAPFDGSLLRYRVQARPHEANFFVPDYSMGHGFFVQSSLGLVQPSKYWYFDQFQSSSGVDWILPGESRPASTSAIWYCRMVEKGARSAIVYRRGTTPQGGSAFDEFYLVRDQEQLLLYRGEPGDPQSGGNLDYFKIPLFSYPNWIGNRAYSLILSTYQAVNALPWLERRQTNLQVNQDRRCWVTVSNLITNPEPRNFGSDRRSIVGFTQGKTIREFTYAIPQGATLIAYSYHP